MARKSRLDRSVGYAGDVTRWAKELISRAKSYSYTHAHILEEWSKAQARLPKGSPAWAKREGQVYMHALMDNLYNHDVKWQLYLDGKRIESNDVPTGRWREVKGRHEWRHSGKLYYASQGKD